MNNISKSIASILILIITISSLSLIFQAIPLERAQSSTNESGIINSDTTWTKANSPYNLTDNIFVNSGVTLTIQAGVAVNFNGYYLMVNGTLVARGTDTDKIILNLGYVIFRAGSASWNEQANSGSIIENAILDSIKIQSSSPKINFDSLYPYGFPSEGLGVSSEAIDIEGGSPIISFSNIIGPIIINGSPSISNNNITSPNSAAIYVVGGSPVIKNNVIEGVGGTIPDVNKYPWTILTGAVMVDAGSPSFKNNTITGLREAPAINACGGTIIVSNNNISGEIGGIHVPFSIENNIINGSFFAGTDSYLENTKTTISSNSLNSIEVDEGTTEIKNNFVGDITIGTVITVSAGPETTFSAVTALIQGNTINGTIHYQSSGFSIISFNNLIIQNNQKTIRLSTSADIDATNNWWGTTDQTIIANSIYDFNNDFNLGKVNFVPFLTAPNPQALTTLTPTAFQQNVGLILPIAVVVLAVLIVFSLLLFRRHRKSA